VKYRGEMAVVTLLALGFAVSNRASSRAKIINAYLPLVHCTSPGAQSISPAWSPDRQKIAFIVDADGSSYTFLTSSGDEPAWAP
jgi:hypothetical protein